jgi:hypothetical protein
VAVIPRQLELWAAAGTAMDPRIRQISAASDDLFIDISVLP